MAWTCTQPRRWRKRSRRCRAKVRRATLQSMMQILANGLFGHCFLTICIPNPKLPEGQTNMLSSRKVLSHQFSLVVLPFLGAPNLPFLCFNCHWARAQVGALNVCRLCGSQIQNHCPRKPLVAYLLFSQDITLLVRTRVENVSQHCS